MISLIVATYRGFDALKSLFTVSDDDTELIIIDSQYSNETKRQIEGLKHEYKRVIYAPPKKPIIARKIDHMSAINTGFAYAEEPWWIRIDDFVEFKDDYFQKAKESVDDIRKIHFKKGFFIRAVELEESNNDCKWKSFIPGGYSRFIILPSEPLGKPIPIVTLGTAISHKSAYFDINGMDERYDDGSGWNDNDMFYRILCAGYNLFLDREQVIYRYQHTSTGVGDMRDTNQSLFEKILNEELMKGDYVSKNGFSLHDLNNEMRGMKKQYEV